MSQYRHALIARNINANDCKLPQSLQLPPPSNLPYAATVSAPIAALSFLQFFDRKARRLARMSAFPA